MCKVPLQEQRRRRPHRQTEDRSGEVKQDGLSIFRLIPNCVVAFAVSALIATGAWAGPRENASTVPVAEAEPDDLTFGRLLFQAGRYRDALVFLEQADPAGEEERLERHGLLGQVYMLLGMPEKAAEQFEAVLAVRPDLTVARLELARAHYAAGEDDRARHHFELSLGARLPSSVEGAVERFLNAIDARKRWSAHFSAALLPETNAVRRTDRRTVNIGGAAFRLNEDARSAPGVGLRLALGGAFFPELGDRLRGHFALSTAAKLYENSAWNDIAVTGKAGLTRLLSSSSVSGGLQAGRRWIGSDAFQYSVGPWSRVEYRISERVRGSVRAELDYRRHDGDHVRDGWRVALNPAFRVALDGQTMLEASPGIEQVGTHADHRSSRATSLAVGVTRAFGNSLTISLSASVQWQEYRGRDPLFDRRRKDRTAWLGGRVLHRSWQLAGFAPYMGYSFEKSASNIELHEYRNHGVIVGLSREF